MMCDSCPCANGILKLEAKNRELRQEQERLIKELDAKDDIIRAL